MSNFLRKYFILLILGIIGIAVGAWRFYKSDRGKTIVDKVSLRLPIVGSIVRKIAISKVTRTLGTLIQSGVSILDALVIVGKTSGNKVIEIAIDTAQARVKQGESITKPLAETGVFPPMVTEMISVGEETGELEKMLTKVADFYDQEVDSAISSLTSTLEPVMMLVLGVVVGGMVIGLYLPIFKLSSVVG
jgi:type IV pilus assembly protein PilC